MQIRLATCPHCRLTTVRGWTISPRRRRRRQAYLPALHVSTPDRMDRRIIFRNTSLLATTNTTTMLQQPYAHLDTARLMITVKLHRQEAEVLLPHLAEMSNTAVVEGRSLLHHRRAHSLGDPAHQARAEVQTTILLQQPLRLIETS